MTNTGKLWTPSGLDSLEWVKGVGTTEKGEAYEAQTLAAALALYQELKGTCDRVRLQRIGDSPAYRVIAYRGGDPDEPEEDAIVDTHELLGNVLQQHMSLSPALRAKFDDKQISFVMGVLWSFRGDRTPEALQNAYDRITNSKKPPFGGTLTGNALQFLDDLIQGASSFITTQHVYRRTVNYSSHGSFTLNDSNVNRIFASTGDLLRIEGINLPNDFILPAGEWMKVSPNQTKQYGQRTQVQYEYWWADEWDELKYLPAQ